ncbi:MAG: hypothetical protein ABIS86_18745 [Streptosporangiaceae bacterium]
MQAISIRQPWAWATARGHRPLSNQGEPTSYRGTVLIHAAMRVDLSSCDHPQIRAAGWDPNDPLAALGAVVAVAELTAVCDDGPACQCGPWAERGEYHWRLESVQPLLRPVIALGYMDGLWEVSAAVAANVRRMLTGAPRPREPREGSPAQGRAFSR